MIDQAIETAGNFATCISTDQPDLIDSPEKVLTILRPSEISVASSSVAETISHAVPICEVEFARRFDLIVTLMPAMVGRSHHILKSMISGLISNKQIRSAMTVARTQPWIWKVDSKKNIAQNSWAPFSQKIGQDLPAYFTEHPSIIVNRREIISTSDKWQLPLKLYELPSWCVGLDIDTEEDLSQASILYSNFRGILNALTPNAYTVTDINPFSGDQ